MCLNKQLYKILFNNNLCDNKTHSKHILNDERIDSTNFVNIRNNYNVLSFAFRQ